MRKGNLKVKICKLCLNTKCDIDFEVVEVIKEVLEIVLPKLNLVGGDEHLLCSSCSVKLFAAFNFKSVCTDTEDTIFPYVNSQEMPLIDLREIYLKEKGDIQFIDILENHKICRLCFQTVRYGFVSLNEVDADIINNYIPEVNFNATKDPVICKVCSDSLVTHGTFLSSCLLAQEENKKVCDNSTEDREYCIKTEEIKIEDDCDRKVCSNPAEDKECCIKTEEIKIEDDCDSDPPTSLENVETIKNSDGRFSSENKPEEYKRHLLGKVWTYTCNRCDFKTTYKCSLKRHFLKHTSLTPTYISVKSQCESEGRSTSSPCPLKGQVRMFQCQKCPYRARHREVFIRHWWTHKVPSGVKVYQCEKCHYRVTQEEHFNRHQLRHEDSSETIGNFKGRRKSKNIPVKKRKVSYTCNRCDYKTVRKYSLKRHCLTHVCLTSTYIPSKSQRENESRAPLAPCPLEDQVRMYQCKKCPYRVSRKEVFIRHWWTHKVPSHVKVYQCKICHYRVTREERFHRHQLRHGDSAETIGNLKSRLSSENIPVKKRKVTYTCNRCEFKTMYKGNLTRHSLKHKVFSTPKNTSPKSQRKSESRVASSPCTLKREERTYQCEKCPYRTPVKDAFITHWSTHEVPPEVKVYQCDKCHYRVTQKNHFRNHQLKHQNGEIVEKYTCDKCDFQTRYKCSLVTHQLLHKKEKLENVKCDTGDDGEPMYKCNVCKYETKNRRQLLVHRCHQVGPTKQLKFKCRTCAYQSDDKDKLTRHQEQHSSGMKTLKCDLCSYQTMWRSNFARHQLRHKRNAK